MKTGDKIIAYCSTCKGGTFHTVVCLYHKRYTIDDSPRCEIDCADGEFSILECNGCESVHYESLWRTSEDDPNEVPNPTRYPADGEDQVPVRRFYNAPRRLQVIYEEVISCFNDKSYVLAAAGIRALMEAVCVEKGIVDGPVERPKKGGGTEIVRKDDLRGKIEGMREKDVISASHAQAFHECRFLGNDAVHDLDRPYREEIKLALDIVEHTLDSVFEVPKKIEEVKAWKASRKGKKKK